MEHLDLAPIARAEGSIVLPGSKSISNRTLLLAALAEGVTEVLGLLDSDDVTVMLAALDQLGVRIQRHGDSRDFTVSGVAGPFPVKSGNFFLGNAGTAFRPLTAALALSGGDFISGLFSALAVVAVLFSGGTGGDSMAVFSALSASSRLA